MGNGNGLLTERNTPDGVAHDSRRRAGARMPRQARLDAPGTPYHVILRGMEHGQMVGAHEDRESFLARLGLSLADTARLPQLSRFDTVCGGK